MKGIFTLVIWSVLAQPVRAQHVVISLRAQSHSTANLFSLMGEKLQFIDSLRSNGTASFCIPIGPEHNPGLYRLVLPENVSIDFVNDNEDVEISSDLQSHLKDINVIQSNSNSLYYEFRRLNEQYKAKTGVLQFVLSRYPHDTQYYAATLATVGELQKKYKEFVESAVKAQPTSFIARYIRSSRLPVINFTVPSDSQLAYLKAHALDHVDFSDEGLIHSDLFTSKSIEYLTYYRNPNLSKDGLEKEFNIAIDTLLNKAKVNTAVYSHITEYLIDGFRKFGFEDCINYILDNYVVKDDLCLRTSDDTIQRMTDQKKLLPIGSLVPDISLTDTSGTLFSLQSLNAEKTLIVFYSTSCPHCQTMIPQLFQLAIANSSLAVYAVSLDQDPEKWLGFVRSNNLRWSNVIDTGGWDGPSASAYHIYATPSMFLLDQGKKLLAKPRTLEELHAFF